jgi:hypothetical protein
VIVHGCSNEKPLVEQLREFRNSVVGNVENRDETPALSTLRISASTVSYQNTSRFV